MVSRTINAAQVAATNPMTSSARNSLGKMVVLFGRFRSVMSPTFRSARPRQDLGDLIPAYRVPGG